MGYKEDLKTNEWNTKCIEILERDHFKCLDCGCIGIHNNSFFRIYNLDDINYFFSENSLLPNKGIEHYIENILLKEIHNKLIITKIEKISDHKFIYQIHPSLGHISHEPYMFAADDYQSFITYIKRGKINNNCNDNRNFIISAECFEFQHNIGNTNYASITHQTENIKNKGTQCIHTRESLCISIHYQKRFYYFTFTFPFDFFSRIKHLNIHHNKYDDIFYQKPWIYSNDELITLCQECHQKRHLKTHI